MMPDYLDAVVLPLREDVATLVRRHDGELVECLALDAQIVFVQEITHLFCWECFCTTTELCRIFHNPVISLSSKCVVASS